MSLTDTDEIKAVIEAVNEGIDSHLEACFCPIVATDMKVARGRPES